MTVTRTSVTAAADKILSQQDFQRIAKVAKSGWGLNLDSGKMPLIQSRLGRRLVALKLGNFGDYCAIIERGDKAEAQHFVAALTTNVTHFFREVHHFEFLEERVLPELIKRAKAGASVRLWSAGCSSGQEPYSLAASLLSVDPHVARYDMKILATDIDPNVLAKAEKAAYPQLDCTFPTPALEDRIFDSRSQDAGSRKVRDNVKELVTFRHLNLSQVWPISGRFDVIMCRNVAIYFDKPTQQRLWRGFSDVLNPDGYLFVGHSERIIDPASVDLHPVGITTYARGKAAALADMNSMKERTCH